jgi:hypothetical protein
MWLTLIACVAAMATLVGRLWRPNTSPIDTNATSAPLSTMTASKHTEDALSTTTDATASTTTKPATPIVVPPFDAIGRIYAARDGKSLFDAARSAPGPDATDAMVYLASLCGESQRPNDDTYVELRARGLTPDSATARTSVAAYKAFAKQFCGSLSQDEIYAAISQHLAVTTPESQQLNQLHQAMQKDPNAQEAATLVWDLIDHAASPAVAHSAAEAAAMAGNGRYAATNEVLKGTLLEGRLERLRGEAAQHAFCTRTGACGPGTYFAARQCREYAICAPGIPMSYVDVLRRVYAPHEMELIEMWSRTLLERRRPGT